MNLIKKRTMKRNTTRCRNWGDEMYLSRIELNTALSETIKALASLSMLHGAVESSFEGERTRRLWRIDDLNGRKYVLILSEEKPDLRRFSEQFGFPGEYETKDYSPLLERIIEGGKWQFRLTANPVVSKKTDSSVKRGKVMPHVTPEHQKRWLSERAEKLGFSLDPEGFQVVRTKRYDFRKRNGSDSSRVRLLSVTFEGVLTVTDADKFKDALCLGIGREKAYGQGLLTIVGVR